MSQSNQAPPPWWADLCQSIGELKATARALDTRMDGLTAMVNLRLTEQVAALDARHDRTDRRVDRLEGWVLKELRELRRELREIILTRLHPGPASTATAGQEPAVGWMAVLQSITRLVTLLAAIPWRWIGWALVYLCGIASMLLPGEVGAFLRLLVAGLAQP